MGTCKVTGVITGAVCKIGTGHMHTHKHRQVIVTGAQLLKHLGDVLMHTTAHRGTGTLVRGWVGFVRMAGPPAFQSYDGGHTGARGHMGRGWGVDYMSSSKHTQHRGTHTHEGEARGRVKGARERHAAPV